jgi:hypothetical protein
MRDYFLAFARKGMTIIDSNDCFRRVDFSANQARIELIAATREGSGGQSLALKKRCGFINRPLRIKQLPGHNIGRSPIDLVDLKLALVVPEDMGIL